MDQSSSNFILLYHLLFGGRIKDLVDKFNISKSSVHRILDEARKEGIYDWSANKRGEISSDVIDKKGLEVIKCFLDLSEDEAFPVVDTSTKTYRKLVALPDLHCRDNIILSSVEKFLGEYQPDIIVYVGDLLELRCLSFFDRENKLLIRDTLQSDYDFAVELMERHKKLSKCSEMYFIEGNHEYRVRRFLESFPQGSGFMEIPKYMRLKERGITWSDLNKFVRIGKLFFTHGLYYNVYHARKHLESYQRNIIYGHTHTIQVHSGIHPVDVALPHVAKSIGCLCDLNPLYMKNRPNQWINAFYMAEIEADGTFNDNIITLVNGNFRIPGMNKRYEI